MYRIGWGVLLLLLALPAAAEDKPKEKPATPEEPWLSCALAGSSGCWLSSSSNTLPEITCTQPDSFAHARTQSSSRAQVPWFTFGR